MCHANVERLATGGRALGLVGQECGGDWSHSWTHSGLLWWAGLGDGKAGSGGGVLVRAAVWMELWSRHPASAGGAGI